MTRPTKGLTREPREPRVRSSTGKWLGGAGDPGGPGRKPAPHKMDIETSRQYHALFNKHCSMKDYGEIIEKAVRDAKQGDMQARHWLSLYINPDPGRLMEGSESAGLTINILVAKYGEGEATSKAELSPPPPATVIDVGPSPADEEEPPP